MSACAVLPPCASDVSIMFPPIQLPLGAPEWTTVKVNHNISLHFYVWTLHFPTFPTMQQNDIISLVPPCPI